MNPYATQAVTTAGPAQLVLMLYDGALAAVTRARLAAGAAERTNAELLKAQDIVTELLVTLDHDSGGQVAANLAALYRFCLEKLIAANLAKDLSSLEPVETVLADLRSAWEAACCQAVAS